MPNSDGACALIAVSDTIELKLDLPFAACCAESSISQKPEAGSSFEPCGRPSPNGPPSICLIIAHDLRAEGTEASGILQRGKPHGNSEP